MSILGLHHITLVCSDAQRTVDFYTQILGLRFIKKTVNFDDPGSYHIYFGDRVGTSGTAITFFEWPQLPKGRPGIGGTHHFALIVSGRERLLKWKRRLTDLGIAVNGPYNRVAFHSIYFDDPDGVHIEIATKGPGFSAHDMAEPSAEMLDASPEIWPEPVNEITPEMSLHEGMHHISAHSSNLAHTDEFYAGVLGLTLLKQTQAMDRSGAPHWIWGSPDGRPGTLISYFEFDPARMKHARIGVGQTHHFAMAVKDAASQLEWREKLLSAGLRVSPVMDRIYFKSIYTSDPDGHIIELATLGPGFTVDEHEDTLGVSLKLPPWYEPHRSRIESSLKPIHAAVQMA